MAALLGSAISQGVASKRARQMETEAQRQNKNAQTDNRVALYAQMQNASPASVANRTLVDQVARNSRQSAGVEASNAVAGNRTNAQRLAGVQQVNNAVAKTATAIAAGQQGANADALSRYAALQQPLYAQQAQYQQGRAQSAQQRGANIAAALTAALSTVTKNRRL